MIQLRMNSLDGPVIFTGTYDQCREYALENGYIFIRRPSWLFHGYFRNIDGECLIPS